MVIGVVYSGSPETVNQHALSSYRTDDSRQTGYADKAGSSEDVIRSFAPFWRQMAKSNDKNIPQQRSRFGALTG